MTIADDGTTMSKVMGTDITAFVDMSTIRKTGDIAVTHDTVITPEGTVIPRIQGASLAGFLDRIQNGGGA